MKLLIMQFSPTCHFISLRSKYSPQHAVLKHPQSMFFYIVPQPINIQKHPLSLCSSLNVRDQVSHLYRTTGKIIVLYILIFMFIDSRRENTILHRLSKLVEVVPVLN
jgi:hypothetical protein